MRIVHLSDFHMGLPSRGAHAVVRGAAWARERDPDLVCITGDLVSRRSGMRELERLLGEIGQCYVVLGNHDFANSRDPFSQRIDLTTIETLVGVALLGDESVELELRGRRIQIVGVDAQSYAGRTAAPDKLADTSADLRILLCHFPGIVRRIPEVFHLILAGHYHAGQIVVPFPGGRLRLAHLRARDIEGVYEYGASKLHVSAGLGTTFVPFRLFARPEVTELVVRSI